MDIAFPQRVMLRARRADHEYMATIAGQLRATGRKPTVTALLRHALRFTATAIGHDANRRETPNGDH